MSLHIQVVTPEKIILDTQADEVTIPTTSGEITVLPGHIPLLAQIAPGGELTVKNGSQTEHVVVVGGFIEIGKDTISILADYAIHGKDIDEARAKEAKERAEKIMKEKASTEEFVVAEAEFQKALLELKIVAKLKRRG